MPDLGGLLGQLFSQGQAQPQAQSPLQPQAAVDPSWTQMWDQFRKNGDASTHGLNRMPFVMNGDTGLVPQNPANAHDQMFPQMLQTGGVRPVFTAGKNVGPDLAQAGVPDSATGSFAADQSWAKIVDALAQSGGLDAATVEKLKGLANSGGLLNQPNVGTAASPQYQSQVSYR